MRLVAKLLMTVFIGPAIALGIPKAWFWSTGDGGRCCCWTFYFIRCKGDFSVSWGCHSIVHWLLMNDIVNLSASHLHSLCFHYGCFLDLLMNYCFIPLSLLPLQATKKSKSSDLKYDIFGWIILAVGIVGWLGFAKSHPPPPPPPHPRFS